MFNVETICVGGPVFVNVFLLILFINEEDNGCCCCFFFLIILKLRDSPISEKEESPEPPKTVELFIIVDADGVVVPCAEEDCC